MNVRVIEANERIALVEFVQDGKYRRVVVPAVEVSGEYCADNALSAGIPSGVDWGQFVPGFDVPALVANELRRRGLWDVQSVLARRDEAKSAFISVSAELLAGFLRNVRGEVKDGK